MAPLRCFMVAGWEQMLTLEKCTPGDHPTLEQSVTGLADGKVLGKDYEGSWEALSQCLEEEVVGSYTPMEKPTETTVR